MTRVVKDFIHAGGTVYDISSRYVSNVREVLHG